MFVCNKTHNYTLHKSAVIQILAERQHKERRFNRREAEFAGMNEEDFNYVSGELKRFREEIATQKRLERATRRGQNVS